MTMKKWSTVCNLHSEDPDPWVEDPDELWLLLVPPYPHVLRIDNFKTAEDDGPDEAWLSLVRSAPNAFRGCPGKGVGWLRNMAGKKLHHPCLLIL
ncbi:odontogenic ameloblast-associated protein isoform X4 [Dendropsophus ebraccatus]|uniref:odontogenic ameloblast-associated protein isoform X4 n=1 Tax=Dendropsophus ebraccatus TaxID=150705 RepID=UPI0038314ABB